MLVQIYHIDSFMLQNSHNPINSQIQTKKIPKKGVDDGIHQSLKRGSFIDGCLQHGSILIIFSYMSLVRMATIMLLEVQNQFTFCPKLLAKIHRKGILYLAEPCSH
jgi:hypothetical protein